MEDGTEQTLAIFLWVPIELDRVVVAVRLEVGGRVLCGVSPALADVEALDCLPDQDPVAAGDCFGVDIVGSEKELEHPDGAQQRPEPAGAAPPPPSQGNHEDRKEQQHFAAAEVREPPQQPSDQM